MLFYWFLKFVAIGPVVKLLTGATFAVLLVYFYREDLFGIGYRYYPISDSVSRSYDELTLQWFSWFTTEYGLLLMWLGICVLMLRRWSASLFALV